MDYKKLLQDTKMSMSKPHRMELVEDTQNISYEYTLKSVGVIPLDFYMDEDDFKEIQEEYTGDSDLWLSNFDDLLKVEMQTHLNKLATTKVDENFLGFVVQRVKVYGDDLKKGSMEIEILALYEVPFNKISESLAESLSGLGK